MVLARLARPPNLGGIKASPWRAGAAPPHGQRRLFGLEVVLVGLEAERAGVLADSSHHCVGEPAGVLGGDLDCQLELGAKLAGQVDDEPPWVRWRLWLLDSNQ